MRFKEFLETVSKRDHLKEWVAKQLFKDWQRDPIMPIKVRDIEDMEEEDKEMFWSAVSDIIEHVKKSKLPLEQAYEDYHKNLRKEAEKVLYKHYH